MQAATQALIAEAMIRSFPQRISGTPIDRELPCVWFCSLCHRFARLEQPGNRTVEQLRRPVSFRATVVGRITETFIVVDELQQPTTGSRSDPGCKAIMSSFRGCENPRRRDNERSKCPSSTDRFDGAPFMGFGPGDRPEVGSTVQAGGAAHSARLRIRSNRPPSTSRWLRCRRRALRARDRRPVRPPNSP